MLQEPEGEEIINLNAFPADEPYGSFSHRKTYNFVKKRDKEPERIPIKTFNKDIGVMHRQSSSLLLPLIIKNKKLSQGIQGNDLNANDDNKENRDRSLLKPRGVIPTEKIMTQINQTFLLKILNNRKEENDNDKKKETLNYSAGLNAVNNPSATVVKRKKYIIVKNTPSVPLPSQIQSTFMASHMQYSSSQLPSPTNHISLKKSLLISEPKKEFKYTYCIFPGNNASLIDKCMKTRHQWEPLDRSLSDYAYFFWTPLSKEIKYNRTQKTPQYVNHLEYHYELSNKMNLFANLMKECESNKINLFSIFPFTIAIQFSHHTMASQLNSFKEIYTNITKYLGSIPSIESKYIEKFNISLSKKIGSYQQINIPETHYGGRNLWLIKPVNLNRGRCIIVENDYDKIVNQINKIKEQKKVFNPTKKKISKAEYIIIQKYIERPLLYQKRKFDIRIWVLFNDQCDVFVFKEGHLKATCDDFDIQSHNPFVHLTNFSVQKYHMNFSKEEKGNEISFADFQKDLDANGTGINFRKDLYPKICNIIKLSAMAVKNRINFMGRKTCFEIFGYDFLIDEDYNPFLIEINTNPGLEESSPLIKMLTARMIDDALKLTVDNITRNYNSNEEGDGNGDNSLKNPSVYHVECYSDNENLWQRLHISR